MTSPSYAKLTDNVCYEAILESILKSVPYAVNASYDFAFENEIGNRWVPVIAISYSPHKNPKLLIKHFSIT